MPGRTARILAVAGLVLALATAAWGFGTTHTLGQNAEHEKITRLSLGCGRPQAPSACFQPLTLNELAGKNGTFGAVGAPDVGPLTFQHKAHCDGGDFLDAPGYPQTAAQAHAAIDACRNWMKAEIDVAAQAAAALLDPKTGAIRKDQVGLACSFAGFFHGGAKCRVLAAFGNSLHAAQDFYAHSNWVDLAASAPIGAQNPPGLGHDSPAPWLDWRTTTAFPKGLITGCFQGLPEANFCNGRTARVKHAYLNKDDGAIDLDTGKAGLGTTPRGASNGNFARAVRAAEAESQIKWATLIDALRQRYGRDKADRMVCAIVSDDPVKSCK
jgi:hypothetical protein